MIKTANGTNNNNMMAAGNQQLSLSNIHKAGCTLLGSAISSNSNMSIVKDTTNNAGAGPVRIGSKYYENYWEKKIGTVATGTATEQTRSGDLPAGAPHTHQLITN